MKDQKRVVVLGGGTGTFTCISGLKKHPIHITAVVSVADDGGSTGLLRDELGVLPPGDIRQCLVALAEDGDILRKLFTYRFNQGSLSGHSFGNLFLSALEKMTGNPLEAIREAQRILRVRGNVVPVSAQASNLYAELEDGTILEGEHAIDASDHARTPIRRCFLSPSVPANPEAIDAIKNADLIVLGPGDLYTSLIPVLLVDGIAQALKSTSAKRALVMNLATKRGQTDDDTAQTFCRTVQSYISPARLDAVIINSATPESHILARYQEHGEHMIQDDVQDASLEVVRTPLLATEFIRPVSGDVLRRSFLRHDSDKLADAVISLLP